MPKRKRKYSKKRKRNTWRKKSRGGHSFFKRSPLQRTRLPLGFPRSALVRLRYVHQFCMTPTGIPTPVCHVFLANGVDDPNFDAPAAPPGVHQPMGRDEMAGIYDKVCVISSTCRLRISTQAGVGYTFNISYGLSDRDACDNSGSINPTLRH